MAKVDRRGAKKFAKRHKKLKLREMRSADLLGRVTPADPVMMVSRELDDAIWREFREMLAVMRKDEKIALLRLFRLQGA